MTEEGLEVFDNGDGTQMLAALTDPSHWSCSDIEDGFPPDYRWILTVPAKRINPYPDAVQLVWFDGKEVDNAAYALFVAAHAAPAGDDRDDAVGQLCRRAHPVFLELEDDGALQRYARTRLTPFEDAQNFHCLECAAWDCAGCGPDLCSDCAE